MPAEAAEPVMIPPDLWQRPEMLDALKKRNIGQVFRLIRQYAGVSQTRIGIAVNLSQGKVSEIMRGSAQVTALDVFERIADGLRMPDPARFALGLAPAPPAVPRSSRPPHTVALSLLGMGCQRVSSLTSKAW